MTHIYLLKELYQSQHYQQAEVIILKRVIFKNYASFTDCISQIKNTQTDNANDINVVMLMYKLMEHSDNYSKTSGDLWLSYRDESDLSPADEIVDLPNNDNNSGFFKFEQKNESSS